MVSVAIGVAVSVAASALAAALTPKPKTRGGLDDLSVLKSELGVPIPRIYGRNRVTGNVFWAIDNRVEEGDSGGKGSGGAEADSVIANFAVMLCEGFVETIGRIWLNNKLVYNPLSSDPGTVSKSAEFAADHLEIYYGDGLQVQSPTIQTYETEPFPAFRHRCYIVFKELNITDYGNSVPKVEVEIIATNTAPSLRFILEDVFNRKTTISSSAIDATRLSSVICQGAILPQDGSSIRDFIEDLQQVYHFITVETNGIIKFVPLNEVLTPIDIPEEELGVREYGNEFPSLYKETRVQDLELPSEVQIEYNNIENDYLRGLQSLYKATATHLNTLNLKTSTALTDDQALTASTKTLEYYWEQRRKYEILLNINYFTLEPGALLNVPIRGNTAPIQIETVNKGVNGIAEISAVSYSDYVNQISVTAPTTGTYTPVDTINNQGTPTTLILDLPLVRDTDGDLGVYGTAIPDPAANGNWNGGTFYSAITGGSFAATASIPTLAATGVLDSDLPAGNPYVVDRHSKFRVVLTPGTGQLQNITEDDFYNFQQLLHVNGELIAVQNATLLTPNQYEIDTFIRGVRGTSHKIASHAIGTPAHLVRGGTNFVSIPGQSSFLGQPLDFKVVPAGTPQTAINNEITITVTGERLRPYAPSYPRITKKSNNDLFIEWTRRTRKNGQWLITSESVPINEDILAFDIEIYNGVLLVVSDTVAVTNYTYSAAAQALDFGALQNNLTFKVYQQSALLGRGAALDVVNLKVSRVEV